MPIYERTTKELMREWAESSLQPGQIFSKNEVINWFKENYPKIKSNTVGMHVDGFATNNGRHRSHHPTIRPNTGWDLFFKEGTNRYRLWDSKQDPVPVYDLTTVDTRSPDFDDENRDPDDEDWEDSVDERTISAAREFAYEKDLQNFLARNLSEIEPGLRVYQEEGLDAIEYPVGGRRIDILAVDANDRFVVIELKASKAYDRVVGQLARYMMWVQNNMETDRPVRGIIVANTISEDLKLAASISSEITLMEYQISFAVKKV